MTTTVALFALLLLAATQVTAADTVTCSAGHSLVDGWLKNVYCNPCGSSFWNPSNMKKFCVKDLPAVAVPCEDEIVYVNDKGTGMDYAIPSICSSQIDSADLAVKMTMCSAADCPPGQCRSYYWPVDIYCQYPVTNPPRNTANMGGCIDLRKSACERVTTFASKALEETPKVVVFPDRCVSADFVALDADASCRDFGFEKPTQIATGSGSTTGGNTGTDSTTVPPPSEPKKKDKTDYSVVLYSFVFVAIFAAIAFQIRNRGGRSFGRSNNSSSTDDGSSDALMWSSDNNNDDDDDGIDL